MTSHELTLPAKAAMHRPMNGLRSMAARAGMVPAWRAMRAVPVLMGGALALSACISVHTPDKPIVIELNINIKQEVVYRLSADAGKTIESNKDIF